jgi:hypothetical protein
MNPGIVCFSSYPEAVVSHTLSTLGRERHTYGDFRHGLRQYFLAHKFSNLIVRYIDRKRIAANKPKKD